MCMLRLLAGWSAEYSVRAIGGDEMDRSRVVVVAACRLRRALLVCSVVAMALPGVASAHVRAPTPWPGGVWEPPAPSYGDTTVQNVRVPMSDGVVLVGDVEYPTDPATGARARGPFPVLLTQNPYSCDIPVADTNAFFVSRGYIFATVCVRGTGRSGGDFGWFSPRDQQDGPELVRWASHLEGANGIVGLTGCSYLGMNQFSTAGGVGPNSPVKAMAPSCTGTEEYREAFMGSGMPTETGAGFFGAMGALIGPRAGAFGADVSAEIQAGGPKAYAGPFWQVRAQENWIDAVVRNHIPALMWSGWRDVFPAGAEELYAYLQNAYAGRPTFAAMRTGQRVTGRYQVVVGPWGHGEGIDQTIQLEWFETWLKGVDTGIDRTSKPMHLWDLGESRWVNASTYPMTARYTPYHLQSGGRLDRRTPAREGAERITWAQPDQSGATLSYSTEPFRHAVTLAGPIGATIYASSSSTNLELIATLSKVDATGAATKLSSGWVIGSLRASDPFRTWRDTHGLVVRRYCNCGGDDFLTPDRVQKFELSVSPRVATVKPGESLRLTLTTQTPAATCAASVLGTDPCAPTAPQAATLPGTYSIVDGPRFPSSINLPLLPYGAFRPAGDGPEPIDWRS